MKKYCFDTGFRTSVSIRDTARFNLDKFRERVVVFKYPDLTHDLVSSMADSTCSSFILIEL